MTTEDINALAYRVGGLLYVPAVHPTIAEKLIQHTIPCLTSVAFCLEDTILDSALEDAEQMLYQTFVKISMAKPEQMPLLFIRIRSAGHLLHVYQKLGSYAELLTGFIFPKFDTSNADQYLAVLQEINAHTMHKIYAMPILESRRIADIATKKEELLALREKLLAVRMLILNIRVGGNDFCNLYGLRRSYTQNIYEIGVIRDILTDILNQFSDEFVVSAPVWEYFGTEQTLWMTGMRQELALDRLNGFIGKTAIHPSQLRLIWESLKVSEEDYQDACRILDWNEEKKAVQKSLNGSRMNELKCHRKWAERIKILGDFYGIVRQKEVCSIAL